MALSEWYSDEEIISELAMFFDNEEEDIDFQSLLGTVTEFDENTFEIKVKGRTFRFNKEICNMEEIE